MSLVAISGTVAFLDKLKKSCRSGSSSASHPELLRAMETEDAFSGKPITRKHGAGIADGKYTISMIGWASLRITGISGKGFQRVAWRDTNRGEFWESGPRGPPLLRAPRRPGVASMCLRNSSESMPPLRRPMFHHCQTLRLLENGPCVID